MKKLIGIILFLVSIISLSSCYMGENEEQERIIYAMDTVMTLKAYGKNAKKAIDLSEDEIKRLDKEFNRKNGGDIGVINEAYGGKISDDIKNIIALSLDISKETDGAFDITVAPLMDLWGFYSKEFSVPEEDAIKKELKKVGYKNVWLNGNDILLKNEAQIDLGGIAKGYLSDRIAEIFNENGVDHGIISLGGNVYAVGEKPGGGEWNIAIAAPWKDEGEYAGLLAAADKAVITSGAYQRYFERNGKLYHHILSPKNGKPAFSGLSSVSIVSKNGACADALSTALFVIGKEKAVQFWKECGDFDMILITDDGEIYVTETIADDFVSDYEFNIINKR